jgi:hypothetical protein
MTNAFVPHFAPLDFCDWRTLRLAHDWRKLPLGTGRKLLTKRRNLSCATPASDWRGLALSDAKAGLRHLRRPPIGRASDWRTGAETFTRSANHRPALPLSTGALPNGRS